LKSFLVLKDQAMLDVDLQYCKLANLQQTYIDCGSD